jgi:hypothetical protein
MMKPYQYCTLRALAKLLVVVVGLTVGGTAQAEGLDNPAGELSHLGNLAWQKAGRARHAGSTDPAGQGNDFRAVKAGETITLLDARGAGIIRRFWMTGVPPGGSVSFLRQAILRMYWDGETSPSVEVPLGDFFGVGFGLKLPLRRRSKAV